MHKLHRLKILLRQQECFHLPENKGNGTWKESHNTSQKNNN